MDFLLLTKASVFAAEKHSRQRRKGKGDIPYINHCLEVAHVLVNVGKVTKPEIVAAALLHDVLEDTQTTQEEIAASFGEEVLNLVLQMSDDMRLPRKIRQQEQIKHARNLEPNARLIKIADKACNVQDIINISIEWDLQKKIAYVNWAEKVVNEIRGINKDLEDYFDKAVSDARKFFLIQQN